MKRNKLLLILAFCFVVEACIDRDKQNAHNDNSKTVTYDQQEVYHEQKVIVVSITPRGVFANEEMPKMLSNFGWYVLGLSKNGKEPIEYIWRPNLEYRNCIIVDAEIGDVGIIYLSEWARLNKLELPQPNSMNPPIIGSFGEIYWKKY